MNTFACPDCGHSLGWHFRGCGSCLECSCMGPGSRRIYALEQAFAEAGGVLPPLPDDAYPADSTPLEPLQ